ncbi:MAG: hypothetical protein Q7T96_03430, partial [Methylobacter sp.]|nr:hypothetical protein [Methylobacter sp.]
LLVVALTYCSPALALYNKSKHSDVAIATPVFEALHALVRANFRMKSKSFWVGAPKLYRRDDLKNEQWQ